MQLHPILEIARIMVTNFITEASMNGTETSLLSLQSSVNSQSNIT